MGKNESQMNDLLQKYYEGATSLEEEKVLEEYFVNHPDPGAEQAWFKGRSIFKQEIPSAKLEMRIVSSLEEQKFSLPLRSWYMGIAATIVLAMVIILYLTFVGQHDSLITKNSGSSRKKITLADGSLITLNINTIIQYPETFDGPVREVWLKEGEAFFEIAKDPKHPFIVHTHDTRTEVVGTSFNIRMNVLKSTEVIVTTGVVSFNAAALHENEKVILNAGTAGRFLNEDRSVERLDKVDPNRLAWITHRLEFNDTPVEEVFRTLETYFNVTIQTSDSSILSCRFRGSFQDASLSEIFKVMTFSLDLEVSSQENIYSVSGKGCKQG
jgi:ferric-dicitrate binding protein FerR (iron transport regulator)